MAYGWEEAWRKSIDPLAEEQFSNLLATATSKEERRAMLFCVNNVGWGALHGAAVHGKESCMRLLLEHTHSAEEHSQLLLRQNKAQRTALHCAAHDGHMTCVQMLLEHARDHEEQSQMLAMKTTFGRTASELAEKDSSNDETRQLLREALAGKVPCGTQSYGKAYQAAGSTGASGSQSKVQEQGEQGGGTEKETGGEPILVVHSPKKEEEQQKKEVEEKQEDKQMTAPITHLQRMQNRWGTDVASVLEGTHPYYAAGYKPPHTAKDCLHFVSFKGNATVLAHSADKAAVVTKFNEGYVMLVHAYTMETEFYISLNRCMRKMDLEELDTWRCCIYHLERAISQLPSVAGVVYRGLDIRIGKSVYKPGSSITWQAFSSASMDLYQVLRFLKVTGIKISGTVFVITSLNARDVHKLSAFPDEEEVVFSPNSHFHVKQDVIDADSKAELLPQLEEYDLSELKVFVLEEL